MRDWIPSKAGQLIRADLDMVLGNDITSPVAINEFEKAGFNSVFDRTKNLHGYGCISRPIRTSKQHSNANNAAPLPNNFDILNYYDVGEMGIEHALLPRKDWSPPGN